MGVNSLVKGVLLIYAIWGFNWVVMKMANQFFPPVAFASYRFILGAIVLVGVCLWCHYPVPPRRWWKWIAITGLLAISVSLGAIQTAMETISAGLAAVLNYTMPMWVAILAHFFLGERLTLRKVIGIAISLFGLCVVMNSSLSGNLHGILLGILAAMAWAVAAVIIKYQDRHHHSADCNIIQYTAGQMIVGAIGLAIYSFLFENGTSQWTALSMATVVYNGVLASAVAFFLWNYLLTRIEAGIASVAILGVPAVGVLCGTVFLGEPLTLLSASGMALTLLGIVIIVKPKGLLARFHA